ncbi:hypothetical protein D3C73_1263620 [compost metagenome]
MTYELVPSRLIGPGFGANRKRVSSLLRWRELLGWGEESPLMGELPEVAFDSEVTVPSWH